MPSVGYIRGTFRDGSGHVVSGGSVTCYNAGTTVVATTYTDSTVSVPYTNIVSGTDGSFLFYVDDSGAVFYDIVLSAVGYQAKYYYSLYPQGRVGNLSAINTGFPTNMTGVIYGNGAAFSALVIPTGLILGAGTSWSGIAIPTGILVGSGGNTITAYVVPSGIILGNGTTFSGNAIPTGILKANGTAISAASAGSDYEAALGNPGTSGFVLSSTNAGTRSWVSPVSLFPILPVATNPYSITSGGGTIYQVSIVCTINLPHPVVVGDTMVIYDVAGKVITVTPNALDRIILNGVAKSDGVSMVSDGIVGTFITLFADSSAGWTTLGGYGIWT